MPRMGRRRVRRVATMAVVGGGAYAVGRSGGKSSAQDEQAQAQAQADAAETKRLAEEANRKSGSGQSQMDKLKELGELHTSGVLTNEEFAAEKKKILGN